MKNTLLRFAVALTPMLAIGFLASPALAAPFIVNAPTPSQTFIHAATVFSSTYASPGSTIINHCNLAVDGVDKGAMTLASGTATKAVAIDTTGAHTVRTTCYDATEASSDYRETSVTVFADSNPPVMGAFSFSPAPIVGTPIHISSNYDDTDFGSGLAILCGLTVNGVETTPFFTLSGAYGATAGTASLDYTFTMSGNNAVTISCVDRSGNLGTHTERVNVAAAPVDTTVPTVGPVSPASATTGAATTISATYADDIGVTSCQLSVDGATIGNMSLGGGSMSGTATLAYTFPSSGIYSAQVTCYDAAGNADHRVTAVTVSVLSVADTTAPTVLSINPSVVTTGASTLLSATFSDDVGVSSCQLYVNSALVGTMSRSGTTSGTATASYTFPSNGNYSVKVNCSDAAGNSGAYTRTVSASSSSSTSPYALQLVKLACPTYGIISVNDPCKAVYYVGTDGKRHAFPNEKAYFTWYTNFDGVLSLDSSVLSTIPLGTNVTYRPGVRMVKFTTLGRVYAVSRYGTLRWVASESAATSLYGSAWNTKIDDISDAFFSDYVFGADINSASDFNVTGESSAAPSINVNL